MKCLHFHGSAVLLFSVLASDEIAFKLLQGRIVVPVRLDGTGPFVFILDTGGDTTILHPDLAAKLKLAATSPARVRTFAGTSELPQAKLGSLELGSRRVENLEIICADPGRLFGLASSVDGIVGQDFLARFDYLIRYRDKRIRFDDGNLREALSGSPLRAERKGGKFYAYVTYQGLVLRFLLDSGIPYPVVFKAAGQKLGLVTVEQNLESFTASSSIGRRTLWPCRLPLLQLGEVRLRNVGAFLAEMLPQEQRYETGILPLNLFDAIYFSNRDGLVVVNPRISK